MTIRGKRGAVLVMTTGALAFWGTGAPAAHATAAAAPAAVTPAACTHIIATAGPAPAYLFGVSAVSASDAWAVGRTSGNPARPVLAHWNGSDWTTVSSPALQVPAELYAVARFPGGAWAVGGGGTTAGGSSRTHLILRVTGGTVRPVPTPGPKDGELRGVAATSAANAWAVGYIAGHGPLILHWNGAAWKRSPLPRSARGRMDGVAATSAANAWAISSQNHKGSVIWHWNGARWRRVPFPLTPGQVDYLSGVTATSPKDAWAVGAAFSPRAVVAHTVIFHWNGARWQRTPSTNPGGALSDDLSAVSASSADDAWAVGTSPEAAASLAVHWNGTSWKAVPSGCGELAGVSVLPSGRAWAVGFIGNHTPRILDWNGSAWQSVPLRAGLGRQSG